MITGEKVTPAGEFFYHKLKAKATLKFKIKKKKKKKKKKILK